MSDNPENKLIKMEDIPLFTLPDPVGLMPTIKLPPIPLRSIGNFDATANVMKPWKK
ncbi:hypothetical protein ACFL6P_10130 [Candidatus Latescibacterota bacterium]